MLFSRSVQDATPKARPRARRIALQAGGFVLGLALLAWCIWLALRPENVQRFGELKGASPAALAAVAGLSILTLLLNGLIFWANLRPARRIDAPGVVAVNAVATFLNYLPFKLSVIFRFLVHHRRDGVPLLTIGSWFAAVGLGMIVVLGPMGAASLWRQKMDLAWIATVALGVPLLALVTIGAARAFAGDAGLARLYRLADALRLGFASRAVRSTPFQHLHAGFAMIASAGWFTLSLGLRVADISAQAGRLYLVAQVVKAPVGLADAFLLACTAFMISVAMPSGQVGSREAGMTALAKALALANADAVAVVALVISAVEAGINLLGAALGIAYLRPDRLLRSRGERAATLT